MMLSSRARAGFLLALLAMAPCSGAVAQSYPSRPVRMLVGYPPGGTSDIVGRAVAGKLGEALGQPVVVENRGGAAGLLATLAAAQAPADGYTILLTASDFTIIPGLQRTPRYDPVRDFMPVGRVITYPHVLVASLGSGVTSVAELIAQARAWPGAINYASGGSGGSNHVSGEWFRLRAGIDITHVPYRGNGPAIADLLTNRVQLLFTSMGPVDALVRGRELRAVAVTGPNRLRTAPDIPTVSESGLPGYDFINWYGLSVVAGTPEPVVARLHAALVQAMATPEVQAGLASLGGDLTVGTPAEFGALIREEIGRWHQLVQATGLQIE
ncbi:Bug family tripartite tricarboxylate transporter substrate binding protein [Muricoccus radiodurans]|uniref:Bug family tripartite tricarboxylate transporter substrate binding protein n=1 Tax=Muricoccus radiodurans TaxID=2231721 RepID=UPI003CEA3BB6